jgi:signal transduction histidine kinase
MQVIEGPRIHTASLFRAYILLLTVVGLSIALWGIVRFPIYDNPLNFILLIALAAITEISATSMPVSGQAGITYHVGPVVGMAMLPFYGPAAAASVVAIASVCLWVAKPENATTWKKTWEQLGFNTGMMSTSIFLAGVAFVLLRNQLGAETVLGQSIPWLAAVLLFELLNASLLMVILRLQHGRAFNFAGVWQENLWAMLLGIVINLGGGFLLAYAVGHFDWVGIVIFFLPIFVSAFSFRLYVRQMQLHMDNLETLIAERTRELADVNREKDAFLAVLTHDMKSPLTSISLYASMLRRAPHLAEQKPRVIDNIIRAQQTLTDIVNNILDLEKLQTGNSITLERTTFEMGELLDYVTTTMQPQASEKALTLVYRPIVQPLPINADRLQLERALTNLVSNAVKYTPEGGTVTVSSAPIANMIEIVVEDNGYGIPVDELPNIFERFRRVPKHRTLALGTGLGLAITKAIVEAHDGDVTVVSTEGVGSVFKVRLPNALML